MNIQRVYGYDIVLLVHIVELAERIAEAIEVDRNVVRNDSGAMIQ